MDTIFGSVTNTVQYIDDIEAPSNCGAIVVNVAESGDEWFNPDMQRQLAGIQFQIYSKVTSGDTTERIPLQGYSFSWNTGKDSELVIGSLPSTFSLGCEPIIDKSAVKFDSYELDENGNKKKIKLVSTFPITILFDNSLKEINELVGEGF